MKYAIMAIDVTIIAVFLAANAAFLGVWDAPKSFLAPCWLAMAVQLFRNASKVEA